MLGSVRLASRLCDSFLQFIWRIISAVRASNWLGIAGVLDILHRMDELAAAFPSWAWPVKEAAFVRGRAAPTIVHSCSWCHSFLHPGATVISAHSKRARDYFVPVPFCGIAAVWAPDFSIHAFCGGGGAKLR
jgi:hypothetical protein